MGTQVWQKVGDARQSTTTVTAERPLSSEMVKSRLAFDNIHYVAQRQVDGDSTLLYMSATTCNNLVITAEVSVSASSAAIRVGTRTEAAALAPLFEEAVRKRL